MRNDIAKVEAEVKNKGRTSPRQPPLSSPTLLASSAVIPAQAGIHNH